MAARDEWDCPLAAPGRRDEPGTSHPVVVRGALRDQSGGRSCSNLNWPARFCLEKILFRVELFRSLKRRKQFRISQSNVWEPGVNPGRLRHCNGYNSQCHCFVRNGKAGKGLKPESGYRLDCARQPRTIRGTSPQREGWSQPARVCGQDSLNAFIPRFAGVWRFFLFPKSSSFALVFQNKTVPWDFISGTKLKDQP